jgi:hypothetical protein
MRALVLILTLLPLTAFAQTPDESIKQDLLIAETAGEAYGCGFRDGAWVNFTLGYIRNDLARAIIAEGSPQRVPAAQVVAAYGAFVNRAMSLYRVGTFDTPNECAALQNMGILPFIDLRTGYIP